MASLYADYIRERLGDEIIESEKGFASYRFLNDGKTIYIVDLYVRPDFRNSHVAAEMANEIGRIGKEKGATEMLGTVDPRTKSATGSLKVLLAYGMSLATCSAEMILFKKEL